MRFRPLYIAGYTALMLSMILLLALHGTTANIIITLIIAAVSTYIAVILVLDNDYSSSHIYLTVNLLLTIVFIILYNVSQKDITVFFLGSLFVLSYMGALVIIMVHDWQSYKILDLISTEKKDKNNGKKEKQLKKRRNENLKNENKRTTKPLVKENHEIAEPPRFTIKEDEEGEWIEIKVKKNQKSSKRR